MNWKEMLEKKSENLLNQYKELWGDLVASEGSMPDAKYDQWKKDIAAISSERQLINQEIEDKEGMRVALLGKKHRLQASLAWGWEDMESGKTEASDPTEFNKWVDERTLMQMELAKTIDQIKEIEMNLTPSAEAPASQEEADQNQDQIAA